MLAAEHEGTDGQSDPSGGRVPSCVPVTEGGPWRPTQGNIYLTDRPACAGKGVTHGAALPLRCDHLLAVRQQLTLDLIADGDSVVTDAHATRL